MDGLNIEQFTTVHTERAKIPLLNSAKIGYTNQRLIYNLNFMNLIFKNFNIELIIFSKL